MLSTIKEKVKDVNTREAFGDIFNGTIQNLALLVIKQSLESSDSPTEAQQELLNRISSKRMSENGEKLIKKLMTGHTTFEDSKYIPDKRTMKKSWITWYYILSKKWWWFNSIIWWCLSI